jgi:hypothetical protein
MPPLENPRHELVAQEIAKGASHRDAYRDAGYSPTTTNSLDATSSQLLSQPKLKSRIAELQQEAAKSIAITLEGQIAKLERLLLAAEACKQYAAAGTMVREQNELAGLRIQRSEVKSVDAFDAMSDEELRAYVEGKDT